jgi:hypothetical protein
LIRSKEDWTILLKRHGDVQFRLRIYDGEGELRAGVKSTLIGPFCFVELAELAPRDLRAQGLALA